MGFPQIGDNEDAMVELLTIIAHNTGGSQDIDLNEGGESESTRTSPRYLTTGPNQIGVELEFNDIEFGASMDVLNLRFDDHVDVAFSTDHPSEPDIIPLDPEDSPFTIGGSVPIRADRLWIRAGPESSWALWHAADDPEGSEPVPPTFRLIAYR